MQPEPPVLQGMGGEGAKFHMNYCRKPPGIPRVYLIAFVAFCNPGSTMALTHKKRRFVAGLMAGQTPQQAALQAGYAPKGIKVAVHRMARCPHVAAHLARARQWAHLPPRPQTDDPLEFMQALMLDPREPSSLRIEAAKALLPYQHARLPPKRR